MDGFEVVLEAPDSHVVKVVLEYGLIGAALFGLVVLLAHLGPARRLLRRAVERVRARGGGSGEDVRDPALAGVALVAMLGFVVCNVTASMFQMYPLGTLFWMMAAAATAASSPRPADQ